MGDIKLCRKDNKKENMTTTKTRNYDLLKEGIISFLILSLVISVGIFLSTHFAFADDPNMNDIAWSVIKGLFFDTLGKFVGYFLIGIGAFQFVLGEATQNPNNRVSSLLMVAGGIALVASGTLIDAIGLKKLITGKN